MSLNLGVMNAAVALDDGDFNRKINRLPDTAEGNFKKIAALAATYLSLASVSRLAGSAVRAFLEDDAAAEGLRASYRNLGQEIEGNTARAQAFAAEMQKITTYGDELTVASMAAGLNYGIKPELLQDATKAAMTLAAKYRLDLATAMMLVGRASQGQTQMLTRYGIVLGDTLTDEEKFNKLLQIGRDEFGLVTDAAQSAAGQIARMKNAVGDSMEVIGREILASLMPLAETAKTVAEGFNALSPATQKMIVRLGAAALAYKLLTSEMSLSVMATAKSLLSSGLHSVAKTAETGAISVNSGALGANTGAVGVNTAAKGVNTGAITINTGALGANSAALGVNAASSTAAGAAASGGFVSRLIGGIGKVTGLTAGVKLPSTGTGMLAAKLGLTGVAATTAGTGLAIVGTAVAGWKIGRAIAEVTGLDDKLTELYGKWFYNMDELDARNKRLDEENRRLFEQAQRRRANREAGEEIERITTEYNTSLLPEGAKDAETAKKLYSELNDVMAKRTNAQDNGDNTRALEYLRREIELRQKLNTLEQKRVEAAEKLNATRRDFRLETGDDAQKDQMLGAEIVERREKLVATVGNKPETAYNADELNQLNEIVRLEAQRYALRKGSAETAEKERADFQEYEAQQQQEAHRKALDRQLEQFQNEGNQAAAMYFVKRQNEEMQRAVAILKREYRAAVDTAAADGIVTEFERTRYEAMRRQLEALQNEAERWADKQYDLQGSEREGRKQAEAVGAWSSKQLESMLGGQIKPAEETARNTKEMTRILRELTSKGGGLNYV